MDKFKTITVLNEEIRIAKGNYISLTDMLRSKDGNFFITDWLRNRNTLEYIGIWERVHNPDFNYGEFATIKSQAGLNSYKISVKEWVSKTNAIGIQAKAGRYGGTYAHSDIAFEFGMWISAEFKIYLVKEFQRLKNEETKQLGWNVKRSLTKIYPFQNEIWISNRGGSIFLYVTRAIWKGIRSRFHFGMGINYKIHTDAIKGNLIPPELTKQQVNLVYASEADLLNMALFGKTAKQWRDENSDKNGNIRDYANVSQLVCLANLESLNAHLIQQSLSQTDRVKLLNTTAIQQMHLLTEDMDIKRLEGNN